MKSETRRNIVALLTFLGALASAFGLVVGFLETGTEPVFVFPAKIAGAFGSVLFISGIVVSIRYLPEDLKEHVRLDDQSVPDNLRKLVAKPEVLYQSMRKVDNIVENIVGNVMFEFLESDVLTYVQQLEQFQMNGSPITLAHTSSVYGTLHSLLKTIPTHACWLGVTHIGSRRGWKDLADKPDLRAFQYFQNKSIELAKSDDINMFRVYITTKDELPDLRDILKREKEAGIRTRHILVETAADRNLFPDVSILWTPNSQNTRKLLKQQDFDDANPVTTIENADYSQLCSLRFESHHLSLLSSVKISSGTDDFEQAVYGFKAAWDGASAT